MKPKVGQVWVSTLGPEVGFRVLEVSASSVIVEVTRRRGADGAVVTPAKREVPVATFDRFARAYELEGTKKPRVVPVVDHGHDHVEPRSK